MHKIEDCNKCPALVGTRIQIVNGYGDIKSKIMFVGICPGNHRLKGGADKSGVPFKGDISGEIFERMLSALSLTRENVYTTNLVKCRPAVKGNLLLNRHPDDDEVNNCFSYLLDEIAEMKPKIIICLGRLSYSKVNEVFKDKLPVIYAWHPAFIARDEGRFDEWVSNIGYHIGHWAMPKIRQTDLEKFS